MIVRDHSTYRDLNASNQAFVGDGWGRGWPGPTNTGYTNAPGFEELTPHDGSPILSDTTYRFVDFEGLDVGAAAVPVHNVGFYGCRIKDVSVAGALTKLYGDGPLAFRFSSFEPGMNFADLGPGEQPPHDISYQYGLAFGGTFNTFAAGLLVESCDIWGFGNAIDGAASTLDAPHIFRHNWIHDAADDGGEDAPGGQYHTDGIGNTGGIGGFHEAGILIEHNTIESLGNTNGIALQGPTTYSNVTVRQNLLGGFGFTVMIWNDPVATDITFTDNWYSTRLFPNFGPLYSQNFYEEPGNVWARNRLHVPAGAAWGTPAHDGRYWIPTGGLDLSDFAYDSSLISSTTDYQP